MSDPPERPFRTIEEESDHGPYEVDVFDCDACGETKSRKQATVMYNGDATDVETFGSSRTGSSGTMRMTFDERAFGHYVDVVAICDDCRTPQSKLNYWVFRRPLPLGLIAGVLIGFISVAVVTLIAGTL